MDAWAAICAQFTGPGQTRDSMRHDLMKLTGRLCDGPRLARSGRCRNSVMCQSHHSSGALRYSLMLRIAMALNAPPVIT